MFIKRNNKKKAKHFFRFISDSVIVLLLLSLPIFVFVVVETHKKYEKKNKQLFLVSKLYFSLELKFIDLFSL